MRLVPALLFLLCHVLSPTSLAQDDTRATVEHLRKLVEELQRRSEEQEARLQASEAEIQRLRRRLGDEPAATAGEVPVSPPAEPTRVPVVSGRKGLRELRLGGRMEIEYVDTQREYHSPAGLSLRDDGEFHIDRLVLTTDVRVTDWLRGQARVDVTGWEDARLQSIWLEVDELPLDGEIRIGKDRRFIAMDRRTEGYPLLAGAFWRKRDIGLWAQATLGPLTGHVSLANGLRLGDGYPGEDDAFPLVIDRDHNGDLNQSKELGLGLELEVDLQALGELDLMGFGYLGRLSDEDLLYLAGIDEFTSRTDRDHSWYGFNLDYDVGPLEVAGQLISADEGGELDRFGYWIQPSVKINLPGVLVGETRLLTRVRPLFRYGVLRNDFEARIEEARTWNRKAWTAAALIDLAPHTTLMVEHTWNQEEPHRFDVRNDEFLLHLRLEF